MAAIHGKNAKVLLSPGSGAAVEVSEQVEYSIEMDGDFQDVTALQASWDSNVKGTMKWSGTLSGNFDTASQTLWSAATSTQTCNFYLYPQVSVATRYYYGTCWVKLNRAIAGGSKAKASSGVQLIGDGQLAVN